MWASCSTWEWEDAIGSLSIAQSEKNINQKKREGKGEKKKSHDLGNHLTLWIIYQETLKQENPLFPIYENVNPEYHRGRSLLLYFISVFSKIQSIWKPLKTSRFPNTHWSFLLPKGLRERPSKSGNKEERLSGEGTPTVEHRFHVVSPPRLGVPSVQDLA